ncbi:DeoR family transcriptional regulator [Prevotellamassilia timonensis]|uniref:DeoR family transcriptional regulator n=1 Tax=Prevotellamassilia timonensis TaxID=1852370 RepID=UPI0040251DBF
MRRTWLCFIIYEIIKSGTINDQVNVLNIATLFGVSGKTIRRDLYVMRDMNLIHYVGSDKTGHWEVKHGKIHMHQL